jgi:hypothetical protein
LITKNDKMKKNTTKISIEFEIEIIQEQCDEMFSCHIPATDAYFSAKKYDDISKTGEAMIKSFINYWNEYNNNGEKKNFSSMIHNQWINGE